MNIIDNFVSCANIGEYKYFNIFGASKKTIEIFIDYLNKGILEPCDEMGDQVYMPKEMSMSLYVNFAKQGYFKKVKEVNE